MPAVVSAPVRLESSEELAGHLAELLDACASLFDVVVVNTGMNWTECHAQLLERSSCSVFVMDQRASSVRTCQHALDLCLRMGVATGPFSYALNRCERGALFSSADIANAMQGAHVFELKSGGSEVEELLGAGLADELASSKNDFCASVDSMLDELLPSKAGLRGRKAKASATGELSIGEGGTFVMPEARAKRRSRTRRSEKKAAACLPAAKGSHAARADDANVVRSIEDLLVV